MPRRGRKQPQVLPLAKPRGNYGVGIEWDDGGPGNDLDLQAVIVDKNGLIVDTVYYNNLSVMDNAIAHSGDAFNGDALGVDESIWCKLGKVPHQVQLIIFVVCAFKPGSRLKDVLNGRVMVMDGTVLNRMQTFEMEQSIANADVVGMFKRTKDNGWAYKEVDDPAEHGSHFVDIIEPCIGDIIRAEIPHAPDFQKVSFMTEKGAVASLPANSVLKRAFVGIGGELPEGSQSVVDIDVSAVFCDASGKVLGAVDGDNDSMFGVMHSGDSTADDGSHGDDEAISIDLVQIPEKVVRIFIILSIANGTFGLVKKAYARIVDQNAFELVRHEVAGSNTSAKGLVVAQMFRQTEAEGRWGFQALGHYLDAEQMKGHSWKGTVQDILNIVEDTKDFGDAEAARPYKASSNFTARAAGSKSIPLQPVTEEPIEARIATVNVDGLTKDSRGPDPDCLACGGIGCGLCWKGKAVGAGSLPMPDVAQGTGSKDVGSMGFMASSELGGKKPAAKVLPSLGCTNQVVTLSHDESNYASTEGRTTRVGRGRMRLKTLSFDQMPKIAAPEEEPVAKDAPARMDQSDVVFMPPPDETDPVDRPRACICCSR